MVPPRSPAACATPRRAALRFGPRAAAANPDRHSHSLPTGALGTDQRHRALVMVVAEEGEQDLWQGIRLIDHAPGTGHALVEGPNERGIVDAWRARVVHAQPQKSDVERCLRAEWARDAEISAIGSDMTGRFAADAMRDVLRGRQSTEHAMIGLRNAKCGVG
eukprot:ctg_1359.g293